MISWAPGGVFLLVGAEANRKQRPFQNELNHLRTSSVLTRFSGILILEFQRQKNMSSPKTLFSVGNFKRPKLGTIILIVLDFQGYYMFAPVSGHAI